jgi:hypothetical protein
MDSINKVVVEIKSVYGNETIYPMNEQGKTFAKISGTKTLSRRAIENIKALGFIIEVKAPTL